MFIFARLIGVSVFTYFLVMFCLLIANTNISVKALLGGYSVILAVMGFFYEPYVTADLYRIREMMQVFASLELPVFIRTYVVTSAVPVARILYWLIGKTGILGLLPAIASLLSYYCIFHILEDAARRWESKRMDVAITLFFVMSVGQYMSVVSNIRTMMSVSLICLCLYRETVEKKRGPICLLLYAIAAGIHTVALPVIAMRMILPVFNKKMKLGKRILLFVLAVAAVLMILVLVPNVANELMQKVNDYIFGDRYSYFWEYLIGVISMGGEIYVLRLYFKRKTSYDEKLDSMSHLLLLCIMTAVVLCFEFSIFHRLITYVCPILTTPLLLVSFREHTGYDYPGQTKNRQTLILVLSLCMLALSCSRGSLCSFKFF